MVSIHCLSGVGTRHGGEEQAYRIAVQGGRMFNGVCEASLSQPCRQVLTVVRLSNGRVDWCHANIVRD
ncbi:hypothetical protein E2C01_072449 [Portunus trituberculatus]|uniref:Uncharacterized protein n=1 Tax=Portunus trituberculatus TaxID=210409 RepID=A0A5B7I7V2_PORTR|nr:hypothetical protein [Portunus trituberculatus]